MYKGNLHNFTCKVCGFNVTVKDKETLQEVKDIHGNKLYAGIVCPLIKTSYGKYARPDLIEYLEIERKNKKEENENEL